MPPHQTFCKEMKKPILIVITCLVVFSAALVFWLLPAKPPGGNEGWSRGHRTGFVNLPDGVAGDSLIPTLERHGFVRVEGRTFDAIVPNGQSGRTYVGFVALRDATAQQPNEFFLGVGPSDTIFYHESHDGSIKAGTAWKDHVSSQINLVEKLASEPR